eukprot:gene4986-5644_t
MSTSCKPFRLSFFIGAFWEWFESEQGVIVSQFLPLNMTKLLHNPSDFLSRHPLADSQEVSDNPAEDYIALISAYAVPKAMNLAEIQAATQQDATLQYLITLIRGHKRWDFLKPNSVLSLPDSANSQAENFMKPLTKAIRAAVTNNQNWRKELNKFLLNYRATPHSTTGFAPATLLFNRDINTKLPTLNRESNSQVHQQLVERDADAKEKMKQNADGNNLAKESMISVGDLVIVKQRKQNKFSTKFNPNPYTVIAKKGTMITAESQNHQITRNISHFKKIGNDSISDDFDDIGDFQDLNRPDQQRPEELSSPATMSALNIVFSKLEKLTGNGNVNLNQWLKSFERCSVIGDKNDNLVLGQILMLCVDGRAKACLDQFKDAKHEPQKLSVLKKQLQEIFDSASDPKDEEIDRGVKRKFLQGISGSLRQNLFIFCQNPYDPKVTPQDLLKASREAIVHLSTSTSTIDEYPPPKVLAATSLADPTLDAIMMLSSKFDEQAKTTHKKLETQQDEINALKRQLPPSQPTPQYPQPKRQQHPRFTPNSYRQFPRSAPQFQSGDFPRQQASDATPRCHFCHSLNHFKRDCLAFKRHNQPNQQSENFWGSR